MTNVSAAESATAKLLRATDLPPILPSTLGNILAGMYAATHIQAVENRWKSSGKHVGGTKNKHGVVSYLDAAPKNAERVRRCIWPCPSESFRAILSGAIFLLHTDLNSLIFAARVSSDNPRLKAFCRVAPSVLFKVRAIVATRVLLFASFFRARTSFAVQVRRRLFML